MSFDIRTRLRAGFIHLLISTPFIGTAVALLFFAWYPAPLSVLQGVHKLVLVLLAVDFTVGPLLTILVFDRAKKSLPWDLAAIGALQAAALVYGMHTLFVARPCIVAFNIDRFDVVTALDVDSASLEVALSNGKPGLPLLRPRIVYVPRPERAEDRTALMFSAALGGSDLPHMAQWYEPYPHDIQAIVARARPLDELRELNTLDAEDWQQFLSAFEVPQEVLAYLPLRAKVRDGAVIIDTRTAEVLRITTLTPAWS